MDAGIEKECSALGGLFQLIMNDMKVKKHDQINLFVLPNSHPTCSCLLSFDFA